MSVISGKLGYRASLFWITFAVFVFFFALLMQGMPIPAIQIFFLVMAVCGAYLAPFPAERYAAGREAMFARLSLRRLPVSDCLLIALAALLLLPALTMLFEQGMRLIPGYPDYARNAEAVFRRGLAEQGVCTLFCSLAALSAICEEFFFRGLFASGLRETGLSRPVRIFSGALFFAIMHLDPWRLLPMCTLGMIMMWLVERSGSIWAPVIYHCTNNASVLGLSLLRSTQAASADSAEVQDFFLTGSPAPVSVLFALIPAVFGLYALRRSKERKY
ncbi:MAG: CPBP family intramembrane metalloprotease [Spirochaetota bacterium]|jgi:membrane protease YdiL (CAAX protease family)|nr:CPBP family intramembrane metalloprotease [Spirochaetota bacterium]